MIFNKKSLSKTLIHTASVLTVAFVLTACEAKTATRGNLPRDYKLAELQIGKSDRNMVARLLGTPSAVSTFDSSIWYYISRTTEQWAFFEPDVIEQNVVAIYFDDQGFFKTIQNYTKEDLREITMQERETATSGHELGILEQLLGNFGKFE